jgi:hypothetical protein
MKKHLLAVLGYIFATFLVQGVSHFVVFAKHYSDISILKPEPNSALGLSSMVIQGAVLSCVFVKSRFDTGRHAAAHAKTTRNSFLRLLKFISSISGLGCPSFFPVLTRA